MVTLGARLVLAWWLWTPAQAQLPTPLPETPQPGQAGPGGAAPALELRPDALPLDALLRRETRERAWAVAVLVGPDVPQGPAFRAAVQRNLLEQLRNHPRVRRARLYEDVEDLLAMADQDAAAEVALDTAVPRVLLARVTPGPEGTPRVRLVVAGKEGNVLRMVEVRDAFAPAAPRSRPGQAGWDRNAGARAQFEAAALTARRGPPGANGVPVVVVMRGNQILDARELDALDMELPEEEPADEGAPTWVRLVALVLTPGLVVVPVLTVLACGGITASFGALVGQGDGGGLAGALGVASVCGALGGCVGLALGGPVGALATALGAGTAYWGARGPQESNVVHPYVAGVNRHNRALAKRLGLSPKSLPKRYFPSAR